MKTLIIILLLLTSCAWSKQDKILYASYLTLSTIDAVQTSQVEREYNPLLQNGDGSPDMKRIIAVKAISGLGVYFIADYFPKYRTPFLWGVTILQSGAIIYNGFQF